MITSPVPKPQFVLRLLTAYLFLAVSLVKRSGSGVPHHDAGLGPSREAPSSVPDLHVPELHIHPTSHILPTPPKQVSSLFLCLHRASLRYVKEARYFWI